MSILSNNHDVRHQERNVRLARIARRVASRRVLLFKVDISFFPLTITLNMFIAEVNVADIDTSHGLFDYSKILTFTSPL